MIEEDLISKAGLTQGEAKVYLALLNIGVTTIGPIIKKSGVARSFAYNILNKLIEKGLVSYILKNKNKLYQASEPSRILDYLEKQKQKLDQDKEEIKKILPKLSIIQNSTPKTEVTIYEGYKGLQTAFEHYEEKLKKGEEYMSLGGYPTQKDYFHNYWKRHHSKRIKQGIKARILFDKDTKSEIIKNRNKYKGCETRKMHKKIKMPAWFYIYKDTTTIFLQENPDFRNNKTLAIEIMDEEITKSFKNVFEEFWKMSKK